MPTWLDLFTFPRTTAVKSRLDAYYPKILIYPILGNQTSKNGLLFSSHRHRSPLLLYLSLACSSHLLCAHGSDSSLKL
jgi:hypothetical protein